MPGDELSDVVQKPLSEPIFEIEGGEIFVGTGERDNQKTILFLANKKNLGIDRLNSATEFMDFSRLIAPT